MPEATAPAAPRAQPLTSGRLPLAEHSRAVRRAIVPAGTAFDATLRPEYWAHVSELVTPFDKFEVLEESGAWYAEVLVISVGTGFVKVQPLFHSLLEEPVDLSGELSEFEIKFAGPLKKHVVIRKSDRKELIDGLSTKVDAQNWVEGHIQSTRRG